MTVQTISNRSGYLLPGNGEDDNTLTIIEGKIKINHLPTWEKVVVGINET